jgi:hypothetical protein
MPAQEVGHLRLGRNVGDRLVPNLEFRSGLPIIIILLGVIALVFLPKLLPRLKQGIDVTNVAAILLTCGAYMVVGPLLMVMNKEVMETLHFDFPLTLAGSGVLTTAIVARFSVACGFSEVSTEAREAVKEAMWHKTVLPIAAAKAATLACGNAVYLHLGLGFIQMLKAFNPVIVVMVMHICGLAAPPRFARWGVYMIICGTLLEVKGELHATCVGLTLMIISEVMEAINLVLTQKLLQNCKFTLMEGLYMISPPSALILFLVASVIEWPRMIQEGRHRMVFQLPWYFFGPCFLGFLVNFVGMAVVQATSSLTVKVLNIARGIIVVLVGIVFYGEYCTPLELCGYWFALVGVTLYNIGQMISSK